MKMSRDQLKALVKECLVELLNEGLGDVSSAPARRATVGEARRRSQAQPRRKPDFDPRLDTPIAGGRQATSALKDAIKRNAGGNPIMESIFADTAMTTLPTQLAHGDVGTPPPGASGAPGGPVQQEQFAGDPEDVFGEDNASRWADLAFMDGPVKKTA